MFFKKKAALVLVMSCVCTGTVLAEEAPKSIIGGSAGTDQGHGTINFTGSIIDAPCSISPDTANQTVEMGQISNALLDAQGETALRNFQIKLEGCAMTTATKATVTFSGMADTNDPKLLVTNGSAKGAAISLINVANGEEITLGQPTSNVALNTGDNNLQFGAKVVSTVASGNKSTPGEFTATANFVMTYQ